VDYEPWHLRYVGAPHAEIMYRSKMVLEDYLAMLEKGDFFRYGDYLIFAQKGESFSVPGEMDSVYISRNTKGGYVLWGNIKKD
jgi:D-alanyl-D-alanine carboxypeptidase